MKDFYSGVKTVLTNDSDALPEDIYAISFWLSLDQEPCEPRVTVGFNTEEQYEKMTHCVSDKGEARWNFAFWLQNEMFVYGVNGSPASESLRQEIAEDVSQHGKAEKLEDWHLCDEISSRIANKVTNIVIKAANELLNDKSIWDRFGSPVPIIVHELEYSWKTLEDNKRANPNGEADEFISYWTGAFTSD